MMVLWVRVIYQIIITILYVAFEMKANVVVVVVLVVKSETGETWRR